MRQGSGVGALSFCPAQGIRILKQIQPTEIVVPRDIPNFQKQLRIRSRPLESKLFILAATCGVGFDLAGTLGLALFTRTVVGIAHTVP
eukprot:6173302-Pleurochrysis_carterae.AAC.1